MSQHPLRILVLIHRMADNSPYCFFVHEQARALRAAGHDVAVIAPVGVLPGQRVLRPAAWAAARATPREAVIDGVPVCFPRYPALGEAGVRLLGGRPMYRAALPVALALHRARPFDLLHAHMLPVEGHAGLLLGRALGVPAALTVHGTDVLRYFPDPGRPRRRNRAIARETPLLMAVSSALAARIAPHRAAPVEVVLNGVDLDLVPTGLARVPRSLISVGTLRPQKCMHATLDAFSALAAEFPDATLTIVGDGPDRSGLEAKVAARGLTGRTTLTGPLPHAQVLRRMAASDAFVMPSYAEGFGIVYIEAMAAGCVAVGSAGEGITDLIRDGENGCLVPAGDAAALIPVLRRLLAGGPAVEEMRARGVGDARALTWARNAARCGALYRGLVSGTAAPAASPFDKEANPCEMKRKA
jgi:glycosyltransferase involved in cell wall biosynthesis